MTVKAEMDASTDEYTTYAPSGETCPMCKKPIKTLELVRRGTQKRRSGGPVVVYRHVSCLKVTR